jgi:hypothetical protein
MLIIYSASGCCKQSFLNDRQPKKSPDHESKAAATLADFTKTVLRMEISYSKGSGFPSYGSESIRSGH